MVVRPWPYRVPLQSYERLNFTVAEGSTINHFEETMYKHYFLFVQYSIILTQSLNCKVCGSQLVDKPQQDRYEGMVNDVMDCIINN